MKRKSKKDKSPHRAHRLLSLSNSRLPPAIRYRGPHVPDSAHGRDMGPKVNLTTSVAAVPGKFHV